ncbi:MAG: hypothetical protein QM750_12480 [Rubrivivax sp.]
MTTPPLKSPADAHEALLHALAAAQSDGTPRLLWSALDAMARLQRAAGRPALAVALAKKAVEHIEAVRVQFGAARHLHAGYLADAHAVYQRLADWLAEDGRVDEELAVMKLFKAEEYSDFVGGHRDAAHAARRHAADACADA